ncbi:MAG TPA: hypothetical protein HA277_02840 [Methanosphaera sp.]|nr:hypothetical protein [Methanosphaera sp.]
MTKKQVVEALKGMDCEIAQVQISFVKNGYVYRENVLVFLVSEPSNKDDINYCSHWWIFSNIKEFNNEIKNITSENIDFIRVTEFTSDKKIDPVKDAVTEETNEEKTIQWYKVKCSMFKEEFGVRLWKDLIDFMSHSIGFDYTIIGQYTKPYTGVEGYYENGNIIKL